MIATLKGIVAEKLAELMVVDVNGVGYGVFVTAEELGALPIGDEVKLYMYEYIRETTHELYGFSHISTKQLFEQLLEVNGVGPKMALGILSLGALEEVRQAIASGDIKFLQTANGVGKRLAERVVVELKDKVGLPGEGLRDASLLRSEKLLLKDEALEALVALGYSTHDAAVALDGVPDDIPTEDRIKQALRSAA
jgi:holliday junction DNA helicase RuvA